MNMKMNIKKKCFKNSFYNSTISLSNIQSQQIVDEISSIVECLIENDLFLKKIILEVAHSSEMIYLK